jgi:hypothetical protein
MGCIRSTRTVKGVVTTGIRYYLTTFADVAALAHSVCTHWGNKEQAALGAGRGVSGRLEAKLERPFGG